MAKKKQKELTPEVKEKKKTRKGAVEEEAAAAADDAKKPQRGLAIGDNFGWTGKLPATLLHEHCQKQKWAKVVFDMKKTSKGFIGVVNLGWENPKTKELMKVTMIPDPELYEPKLTTNEARHYAATYALFRLNYAKNLKMILPKIFRDYWSDLDKKRLEVLQSNKTHHDNIYNPDPFMVVLNQREKEEQREKERKNKEQNSLKERKPIINIASKKTSTKSHVPERPCKENSADPVPVVPTFSKRVWENAPFIDFPSEIRVSIENSIRHHITWHSTGNKAKKSHEITASLMKFGFREAHITEALGYTSNFTDALEWLLFHVPEDDLPPFFSKTDKDSGVSFKISTNIQHERLLERLSVSGFDKDEIENCLSENSNDERLTAVALTNKLLNQSISDALESESQTLWEQELEGLQLTREFAPKYVDEPNKQIVVMDLCPKDLDRDILALKLYKSENYPHTLPGIHIIVRNRSFKLANYIKLSVVRQVAHYIRENSFLGECCLFQIVEYVEQNIARIIDHPGPLVEGKLERVSSLLLDKPRNGKNSSKTRTNDKIKHDSAMLKDAYNKKQGSFNLKASLKKRVELPAWKKKDTLVKSITSNRITLVTGETGSGKSTQVVQYILDEMNSTGDFDSTIMCTQPRRISTIGLAERISDERDDKLGNETGYIIRGENKTSKLTRISFITTGVLLRIIQSFMTSNGQESKTFDRLKYIFIDEVHERSVDSDFLLIILKQILKGLPNLKIVLMSATIDETKFRTFFDSQMGHIHIEGRTFPIKDFYLDTILKTLDYHIETNDNELLKVKADSAFFKQGNINYDLISKLCLHISRLLSEQENSGSILVFLPGIMEVNQCKNYVERTFKDANDDLWCLPLHSALPSLEQQRVFKHPPRNTRKIVVATNVAETSITIPDCVAVVDSGRSKMMYLNSKMNSTKLVEGWCSRAEIKQRRGRAGRITEGNCYHLYTHETEDSMLPQPIPEIKRSRLENLYLTVKSMGINKVEEFLRSGMDAPDSTSLENSKQFLNDIGALKNDSLTHLGKYISLIPTDLQNGKLMIYGCIFGCVEMALNVASIRSAGNLIATNHEKRDVAKQILAKFAKDQGDIVGLANIFSEYEVLKRSNDNTKRFISDNMLSYTAVREISSAKTQYLSILKDIGFIPFGYNSRDTDSVLFKTLNRNGQNFPVIRAIITGAYYPQIAKVQIPDPKYIQSLAGAVEVDPDATKTKLWIKGCIQDQLSPEGEAKEANTVTRAFLHPSSTLFINSNSELPSQDFSQKVLNEDGSVNLNRAREMYDDVSPQVKGLNWALKVSFIVYGSSHHTSKFYLRDVTPSSTLATLLFGGDIAYDVSSSSDSKKTSPGIILDHWVPIRTWCKNGVLIKRLRVLLDTALEQYLDSPHYTSKDTSDSFLNLEVISIIERILHL